MNGLLNIDIPLAVVGCDFRIASTPLRERLVSTDEQRAELFQAIRRIDPEAGFAALETCNRVEWIVSTENPRWMAELLKARVIALWNEAFAGRAEIPEPLALVGFDALRHLLRVVVGMESLATGEAQIAGQFQDALGRARKEKTSSVVLHRLSSMGGRLAKAGYRLGYRSNHRQGIHGLVCRLFQAEFGEAPEPLGVLVVGMGKIGRKTAQMLEETLGYRVVRVNRTVRPEHSGIWRPLDELPELTADARALVVATGALQPVITAERLGLASRGEPLLIMDIGIPRQVDPAVQGHGLVRYRTIDDLLHLPQEAANAAAAAALEREIEREMERFARFCMERDMATLLDCIHRGRQEYIYKRMPQVLDAKLGHLENGLRKEVEAAVKQLIGEYANDIHSGLQAALEEFWSRK
jgi:glutamyl-tRNA reductase